MTVSSFENSSKKALSIAPPRVYYMCSRENGDRMTRKENAKWRARMRKAAKRDKALREARSMSVRAYQGGAFENGQS